MQVVHHKISPTFFSSFPLSLGRQTLSPQYCWATLIPPRSRPGCLALPHLLLDCSAAGLQDPSARSQRVAPVPLDHFSFVPGGSQTGPGLSLSRRPELLSTTLLNPPLWVLGALPFPIPTPVCLKHQVFVHTYNMHIHTGGHRITEW